MKHWMARKSSNVLPTLSVEYFGVFLPASVKHPFMGTVSFFNVDYKIRFKFLIDLEVVMKCFAKFITAMEYCDSLEIGAGKCFLEEMQNMGYCIMDGAYNAPITPRMHHERADG